MKNINEGFNLVYLWVYIDNSVKSGSIYFGKTILLNKPLLLEMHKNGAKEDTTKDVRCENCQFHSERIESGAFSVLFDKMYKEKLTHIIVDDYFSEVVE